MGYTGWLILGVVLLVIEIVTPTFFYLWFSIGFFAAALVAILGANLGIQIAVFAAVSTLLVLFTRPIAKRLTARSPRKLFIEEILGSTGVVTEDVNASTGTGRVKVRGEEWRAYPHKNKEIIPKGSSVLVERVEGNIIYVRPLDESSEQEV
jgi:membrane protein implicated in regulation of membrane protease activity